jgi:hypothetical protein
VEEKLSNEQRLERYALAGLGAWLALGLYVAWRCRYWINSDTIGSLDSARALRALDFANGLNGYFGAGFAAMLAPLDLTDLRSFLSVHLVTLALLLATQALLYAALRHLNVTRVMALALTTAWAAACCATGGAVYMTADVALCFWGAAYVLVVVKHVRRDGPVRYGVAATLGALHAIAGITKSIAFPTLIIFPIAFVVALAIRLRKRGVGARATWAAPAATLAAYLIPLVVLGGAWGSWCQHTYGRVGLGGSAAYNYELYTLESETLPHAIADARMNLTAGKSFWWSDPLMSVQGWDHRVRPDLVAQTKRVLVNVQRYLTGGKHSFRALVFIGMLGLAVIAAALWRPLRGAVPAEVWLLALVAWLSLAAHLSVLLYPRHLAWPALFCLPLVAVAISRWMEGSSRFVRKGLVLIIVLALGHGVASMIYAAEALAPGDEHFRIADAIGRAGGGPIGAYLEPGVGPRSYGTIAFLTGREAAEIVPVTVAGNEYEARFEPETILLIGQTGLIAPERLRVNRRSFVRAEECNWAGGSTWTQEKIVAYFPDAAPDSG